MRHYSFWDPLISHLDETLRSILVRPVAARRPSPAEGVLETELSPRARQHAGGLMRVNHVGELCAQALYQGQAMTSHSSDLQKRLQTAAAEEMDHLHWCRQRLQELDVQVSYLNPLWYAGALLIGFTAGLFGDPVSLGFLAATEHQVEEHLRKHLGSLPSEDRKSRAIVEQMCLEESEHAAIAERSGARPLPLLVQWAMRVSASVMILVAYRI